MNENIQALSAALAAEQWDEANGQLAVLSMQVRKAQTGEHQRRYLDVRVTAEFVIDYPSVLTLAQDIENAADRVFEQAGLPGPTLVSTFNLPEVDVTVMRFAHPALPPVRYATTPPSVEPVALPSGGLMLPALGSLLESK